jgi:succinate-acetate transporter protein
MNGAQRQARKHLSDVVITMTMPDMTANPAPLGLMGFAMTTILLNIHNAGVTPLSAVVLGMGIFYGGLAQVIAGLMEWKKGNTFGTTAFLSYGLFWLSLVAIWMLPALGLIPAPSKMEMSFYLFLWGTFTAFMFIGTLRTTRALQFVFASLALLFFLLALGDATNNATIIQIAGIEGIICGASAMYTGLGQVLNETLKREVLPLFPVRADGAKAAKGAAEQ